MARKVTTEEFIHRSKLMHNNNYDYGLVEYTSSRTCVKIKCIKHGIFEQTPNNHLMGKGCKLCGYDSNKNKQRKNTEYFIKKASIVHNNKYDYSKSQYINNRTKVEIICPEGHVFEQTPEKHLYGQECSICHKVRLKKGQGSWSISSWERRAKDSKSFDSFKVYIIRCWDENEEFYKIGRTYTKVDTRFNDVKKMPYNYDVIEELVFKTSKEAHNKETELKRLNKEFKYIPKKVFRGMQECFSQLR